jgi:hypothetical protein
MRAKRQWSAPSSGSARGLGGTWLRPDQTYRRGVKTFGQQQIGLVRLADEHFLECRILRDLFGVFDQRLNPREVLGRPRVILQQKADAAQFEPQQGVAQFHRVDVGRYGRLLHQQFVQPQRFLPSLLAAEPQRQAAEHQRVDARLAGGDQGVADGLVGALQSRWPAKRSPAAVRPLGAGSARRAASGAARPGIRAAGKAPGFRRTKRRRRLAPLEFVARRRRNQRNNRVFERKRFVPVRRCRGIGGHQGQQQEQRHHQRGFFRDNCFEVDLLGSAAESAGSAADSRSGSPWPRTSSPPFAGDSSACHPTICVF